MLDAMAIRLASGESYVTFKSAGSSMTPLIRSGQEVTVHRVSDPDGLEAGDIVLARVHGVTYLHKITAINRGHRRVQIGNNHGRINGWTSYDRVYGIYRPDEDAMVGVRPW